uniref:Uncharacterized protein n=1 Tax=Arundo donax TaxID=35708 RepID=A0A0A9E153_ARUDO
MLGTSQCQESCMNSLFHIDILHIYCFKGSPEWTSLSSYRLHVARNHKS